MTNSNSVIENQPQPDPQLTSTEAQPHQADLGEFLDLLWRRRRAFFWTFFIVMSLATLYTFTRPWIFESSTQVVIGAKMPGSLSNQDAFLASVEALTANQDTNTQVAVLSTDQLIHQAFFAMSPAERFRGFHSQKAFVPAWCWDVQSAKDTNAITIVARSYDQELARKFSYLITKTYQDRDLAQNNQSTHQARSFVEAELKSLQKELADATMQLATFQKTSNLIDPTVVLPLVMTDLVTLRTARDQAHAALIDAQHGEQATISQVHKVIPEVDASKTITDNPTFAHVRDTLSALRDQLFAAEAEFRQNQPEVQKLNGQIKQQEAQLSALAHATVYVSARTKARAPTLDPLLQALATATVARVIAEGHFDFANRIVAAREDTMSRYPSQARTWGQLMQKVSDLTRTYSALVDKRYELLIDEKSGIPSAVVTADAEEPTDASFPKFGLNMLAAMILGLILATGAVMLSERLDNRMHDPVVVSRIAGLTTVAGIPETEPLNETSRPMIGQVKENNSFLEAFRLLRNNIAFSSADRDMRIVAITSPSKSEGKTTISANLAISMAMDGKRVLLIDADLRRPSVHTAFGLSRETGFTNVVKGMLTLEEAVIPTSYANLHALPSGPLPPDPAEFLNSSHARAVFTDAVAKYDVVILDSTPTNGISDVQVITRVVDGVLLVIALDTTTRQEMQASVHMLRQISAPVIGIVLNRMRFHRGAYGYYGYYSYYGYYNYYTEDRETGTRSRRKGSSKKKRTKVGS